MPCSLLCCVRQGVEDIRELDYSHCSLSDVPNEVFVYERTLERLHCQSNHITELSRQLFICHELRVLNISDNEIQELPSAISSLVNLQLLDCSKNAISTLPETTKCLKQLFVLDMSVNPLEKVPEAITNLIFLQELFLNDVYLEYLPGNFGRLTNLKILELRDNYLMILPKSLARSSELLRLDIGQNDFNEFPEVVGKFTKLQELWVDCNNLNTIPPIFENLTKLVHFEASNNMITDLPAEISFCRDLVELCISSNQLNQLPDTIGNLTNLVSLKLDSNKLFVLPDSIGDLSNLEELMLYSNFLCELPSTIGRLRKLQILNVDENMLKAIPPEIGSCSSLTVLSVRSNRLTFVPSEVGHLSALKVLNLVRNSLQSLPHTLLNCGNLVALWLSENQSKPLVPMQSEIDLRTRQQVLTCFLFPQVPDSPSDPITHDRKSNSSDAPATPRHISFVDMKAAAKGAAEKPGQLRRAPTPYPKELRALAKHARNIQKDSADEALLSMQNAVHIKAAKITPTLQQRFASNHSISGIRSGTNDWNDTTFTEDSQFKEAQVPYESPVTENPYDKPIVLEPSQSYQNLDQTLYSESNDSAYGGYADQLNVKSHENNYEDTLLQALESHTIEDRVEGIIKQSSHDLYPPMKRNEQFRNSPLQRMDVPSPDNLSGNRSSIASSTGNHIYPRSRDILNRNSSEKIYGIVSPPQNANPGAMNGFNHLGLPCTETYAQAKEKIYGRRREDVYGGYTSYQSSLNAEIKNNMQLDNYSYSNLNPEPVYFTNHRDISASNNHLDGNEPSFNANQRNPMYHHQNHINSNVDTVYDTSSVSSKQGIYGPTGNRMPYHNSYNIYEALPNANPVNGSEQRFQHPQHPQHVVNTPINPPPYHIAATYSKQAQFFNPNS